jgi:Zn-dependent protease with chaperone function
MANRKEDLDPVEQDEMKGKAGKGRAEKDRNGQRDNRDRDDRDDRSHKSGSGKKKALVEEDRDADEGDDRKARGLMVGNRKVPYPPSPADVPEDLTEYADSYVRQENLLLAGLFVFLSFYIGAILFSILIGVWCVWSLWHLFPLKVVGIACSSICLLFLLKGFLKGASIDRDMNIEITEEEHPLLFAFIEELCDEVGAPLPDKVLIAPDVNAMCITHTSLFSLFVEPKKDLLVGLGLVNAVNLSEFKAIVAHEFGHFSQTGSTRGYAHIAQYVMIDMIRGEDWFDRVIENLKRSESMKAVGYVLGAPLWLWRTVLWQLFQVIALQSKAVSREREFHADLVAVSAAGSDAATHGLLRARFGMECFIQALRDLHTALDHKLYTNDLYLHQSRAATVVRRVKKEPELGMPPALDGPNAGKKVRVFDAEQDELEDEDDTPPMWRSHPSDADREENAKEQFVAAPIDQRSPWILFDDVPELKERMTYKFFRMHQAFRIPKNADLTDAVKVQKFIDNEHADTTYDPKYKGAYDERILEPGDLDELNGIMRESPWTDERMEKVLDKLYDDCEEHAEAHSELYKEMEALQSSVVGRPSPKLKRKMKEVEEKQDENRDWFKSFDRRVYLLHMQMAAQVDKELRRDLLERYRFQLEVQRLFQESRAAFNKADAYLGAFAAAARNEIQLPPDFAGEVIQVLRESWKALKNIIKDAREINLPAMKNFEEGENLADFILEGKMVPEPPLSYVKGAWIDKLMTQLQGVRQKCFRLHFKSVGGILRLQEDIAAKWRVLREPVAAEVVDEVAAEPIAAEVIPAEVIPAEVLPTPLPPPPQTIPEPPKSVAAFVAPVPPPPAPVLHPASPVAPPAPIEAEVIESEVVAAEVIEDPVPHPPAAPKPPADLKSLDLSDPEPAPAPAPAAPAGAAVFAFDSDEPSPAPAKPAAEDDFFGPAAAQAQTAEVAAAEPGFPLNADDHKPAPPSTPALSGVEPSPAPRTPPGSGATRTPSTRPASGKRPAIKITMLRPGEPSPLMK